MKNLEKTYNENYKKLLLLPAIILTASLLYLIFFYVQTGDFINKDISLTGGTSITFESTYTAAELESKLAEHFEDFTVKTISDNAGNQLQLVVTIPEEQEELLIEELEEVLGKTLTNENSSRETTSASLSNEFYKQLIVSVLLAFFWMAGVVFLIFSKGKKLKFYVVLLNILFGFFMGNFFLTINKAFSAVIFLGFAALLINIYIKNSIPAFAVMLSAFANIVMTLALVNILGISVSIAGLVAFLMLIGYSVDTDILLTSRILKKKEGINEALLGAFKTGTTMTITSIIAITTAFILLLPFGSVLNQIFSILLIGLCFDLFNTWVTNASILKWYAEERL